MRLRLLLAGVVAVNLLGGCCTTPPQSSFSVNVRSPIEVSIPSDQKEVRLPLSLENTSSTALCFADQDSSSKGFRIYSKVSQAPDGSFAPINASASGIVESAIFGRHIDRGRSFASQEGFYFRLVPASGARDGQKGLFLLKLLLQHSPDGTPSTQVKFVISLLIRRQGSPVLISEPVPRNSETAQ